MGWFSFFIILCYSSYPGKVKRLEKKVKKFERNKKGEGSMSKIISSLVGQVCKIESEEDIFEAIDKHVLSKTSYLYDEPNFLLQQEVSEIGSYFSIIKAIAAGNSKLSAIAAVLETKATSVSKYLKTLIDLDILEREVPVTEDNPEKCKKGLYKIKDNYLRFWFAFVYPNKSFLESGHSEIVIQKIKNSLIKNQTAFVYEDVCKEKMWELNTPYNVAPNIGAWIEMATLPLMKVFYQRRTLHRCVD